MDRKDPEVIAPERTLQQRQEALQEANRVRKLRAYLKVNVATGRQEVAAIIADPPTYALTMRVLDLLLAVPSVARIKADIILRRAQISPSKTLGGMTGRQRAELVRCLPDRPYAGARRVAA